MIKLITKTNALLFVAFILTGCGGGSTTEVVEMPAPPPDSVDGNNYNGPAPATEDVQSFKLNVWDNLSTQDKCGACHIQDAQTPEFVRNDDINLAYQIANTLINQSSPRDSLLITKVAGGHNCWLASIEACEDLMVTWIEGWIDTDESALAIELEAPLSRQVGANKNFPESPALFADNLHPFLETYCGECHQSSASIPISPYMGSSDVSEAYLASISKINLDIPEDSRIVARVRDEFHNCWSGNCADDAQALTDAIAAMADAIPATQLDANLVASDAVGLFEGTLASGGGRFENNLIAKWEFKTGFGNTAFDTSGVSPALDLTLSGEYDWVGGWGIQLRGGKAQGSTSDSRKLYDQIVTTGEFSVEAWIAPANVTQEGPARIITYSGGDERRNFMLGQTLYNYDFLLRNENTDANGAPSLSTRDADEDLQAALQHVVINYSGSNGREIYVNGEFTDDTDAVAATLLNDWDDSFAFAIGSEVSGRFPFQGTVRMVAIHNRVLSPEQITSNFDAGIGQKFYVLFGISNIIDTPDSFIAFEVSQFDTYSYLFSEPFAINLSDNSQMSGINIEGMRIGLNGREEKTGQVFATLATSVSTEQTNAVGGFPLSRQGTIIPVQKGPELDEFFLTFDRISSQQSSRQASATPVATPPSDIAAQAQIGIRDFAELNASMSELTTVSPQETGVFATFTQLRQQLPSVTNINTFVTANQMAITQLAIKYCDALVESDTLATAYFPAMDFSHNANSGFDADTRNAIIQPLISNMLGENVASQPDAFDVEGELNQLIDRLTVCSNTSSCSSQTTATVVKASCAAVLGSAVVTIQ